MNVTASGVPVSVHFPSTMTPLQPSNSNIAQSFYVLLSCTFFLTLCAVLQRRGLQFVEQGLVWAAGINAVLGVLDMIGLDPLLSVIRTADYTLANEHTVAGLARVIGGFSEASVYGAACAGFYAYFGMSYLVERRQRDGILALVNLLFGLLSFSSTAVLALAAGTLFIILHMRAYLGSGMSRVFGHVFVIFLALLMLGMSVFMLSPGATDFVANILDYLIFSKSTSLSGLERGAWAEGGWNAFLQTWGLGAGAGSLRANGYVSVLLGSVGIIGTLAFAGFAYSAIGGSAPSDDRTALRIYCAGRVCALTLLVSLLVSSTSPDPTLFLVTAMAIAVVARQGVRSPSEHPSHEIRGMKTAPLG